MLFLKRLLYYPRSMEEWTLHSWVWHSPSIFYTTNSSTWRDVSIHDQFIYVTRPIHLRDVTWVYIYLTQPIHMWHDSCKCDMTHMSYDPWIWGLTLLYVTRLVQTWHDSFVCVMLPIHAWHDSFIYVIWFIYISHDWCIYVHESATTCHICVGHVTHEGVVP